LGRRDQAVIDFSKVIELYPNDVNAWLSRGRTYRRMGQWDKAVIDFSQVIERKPDLGQAWMERGWARADLGQWKEAAADFTKLVALHPDEPMYWYNNALAYLGAGDAKAYRNVCAGMLQHFKKTKSPAVAGRVVSACVAGPKAIADPAQLIALAKLACSENPDWNAGRLGAALYRADKPGAAQDCFDKKAKRIPPRASDLLFLAMAHLRLGQADRARNCLTRAVHWMDAAGRSRASAVQRTGPTWECWQEQIAAQVLRSEAEALLKAEDEQLPTQKDK
jgi:tetratricopeptide (TPR) repeat protein